MREHCFVAVCYFGHGHYLTHAARKPQRENTYIHMASPSPPPSPSPSPPRPEYGCKHYARVAKLRAPCCGEVHACRKCHDEVHEETGDGHMLDRRAVTSVVCAACGHEGPPTRACGGCGIVMGTYFCLPCRMYDSTPGRSIYHCDKCGLCRTGVPGINYQHCDTCNVCFSLSYAEGHTCYANRTKERCAICRSDEDMHDSCTPLYYMPYCRHTFHQACIKGSIDAGSARCPICRRSAADMSTVWAYLRQKREVYVEETYAHMVRSMRDNPRAEDPVTAQEVEAAGDALPRASLSCSDCSERTSCAHVPRAQLCAACGSGNVTVHGVDIPPAFVGVVSWMEGAEVSQMP